MITNHHIFTSNTKGNWQRSIFLENSSPEKSGLREQGVSYGNRHGFMNLNYVQIRKK